MGRARPGEGDLASLLRALGEERCSQITHVSADGADWISAVVAARCPNAVRCADPFHIVKWATEALDDVRRQAWNAARSQAGGRSTRIRWSRGRIRQDAAGDAKALKHARYALWKNPENLPTPGRAPRGSEGATVVCGCQDRPHRAPTGSPAISHWLRSV